MDAAYVFRVQFRLAPTDARVDPAEFETTLELPAADPGGGDDWLFFRDHLWRGEISHEPWLREIAADRLGVDVTGVTFRELRTDEAYLDALKEAVAADLGAFRADSVSEALTKYFGSSIHVRDGSESA